MNNQYNPALYRYQSDDEFQSFSPRPYNSHLYRYQSDEFHCYSPRPHNSRHESYNNLMNNRKHSSSDSSSDSSTDDSSDDSTSDSSDSSSDNDIVTELKTHKRQSRRHRTHTEPNVERSKSHSYRKHTHSNNRRHKPKSHSYKKHKHNKRERSNTIDTHQKRHTIHSKSRKSNQSNHSNRNHKLKYKRKHSQKNYKSKHKFNVENIRSINENYETPNGTRHKLVSNHSNIEYYKKEIVSQTDTSFWPYYRLTSDISRCNSYQLLQSIESTFGLDSIQNILSQFMIEKLNNSLNLKDSNLLYLTPKQLMKDNNNNIFENMRHTIPSLPHPSFLYNKIKQQQTNNNNNNMVKNSITKHVGMAVDNVINDVNNLELLIFKKRIGYRIISYCDHITFINVQLINRQFLYISRLPQSRSHLRLRIGKINSLLPISTYAFIKNRIDSIKYIQLLHIIIDKPKWDILKILLSRLLHLRQLDLTLPALQSNYIMPTKMLSKKCKMLKLKMIRINGPRKLKASQQYPDISYLLRDLLKKIEMPNLHELSLIRVCSKTKNTIYKFLKQYKTTLQSLEFELPISLNCSLIMLNEMYGYCKHIQNANNKVPLRSLSFKLIRDTIGLINNTYHENKNDRNSELIKAINISNRLNLNKHSRSVDNANDNELYDKILNENELKLDKMCIKIINQLSFAAYFERLVFSANINQIHWNEINKLQTLRNLHIMIKPNDMKHGGGGGGFKELCVQCGHTLTNLTLTIYNQHEEDLLDCLNENLKSCKKLRHIRVKLNDISSKVSIDSFCSFIRQHSAKLVSIELHCYYLTFDIEKFKQNQSELYIPNVKKELQKQLENLFLSCKHLKSILIRRPPSSHRKYICIQRLFQNPHTVGAENFDLFIQNQFL